MSEIYDHQLEVVANVATITLNRPAAYNALTRRMLSSLLDTVRQVAGDAEVRAVVITGAGKGFCSGQALDDTETVGTAAPLDIYATITALYNPLIVLLLTMEKPVIAALNGGTAGAGLGIALSCDLRVAAHNAVLSTAFVKIGLVPDCGISLLLPRIVGYARALELALLSPKIDAATAQSIGLVTRCVPPEHVLGEAQALAASLATGPRAIGLIKREFARNALGDIVAALKYEAETQTVAGATADAREGIAAFSQKRSAVFCGV